MSKSISNLIAYYNFYMHNSGEIFVIAHKEWHRAHERLRELMGSMEEYEDLPEIQRQYHLTHALAKIGGEWRTII